LQTKNLTLVPHAPAHLIALSKSVQEYEKVSGFKAAESIREFLLAASPDFFLALQTSSQPDPWRFGFAIFYTAENLVIGLCGFAGPPDSDNCVEIGYSIVPAYQGRGFATEAAQALIEFAAAGPVGKVRAHTLAKVNPSTRVLEKCGFAKTAEMADPKGQLVWRWERPLTAICG
jgi:RimJ/RimL family protein N-acetyltransferase